MFGGQPDPVEDLLAAVLQQPEPEWERALAQACVQQPAHAQALRDRFRQLVGGDQEPPAPAAIPESLGRYDLIERIGAGGMGVVYRARDRELEREVALKLVRPELLYFPGARERFRREVSASAALQHEGIVTVHEFGEVDGIPFFAMELIRGLSLAEVIDRLRGRAPDSLTGHDVAALLARLGEPAERLDRSSWWRFCGGVIASAAHAVHHAHTRGVVHRDLKPGNLMLTCTGRLRVLDFGLSLREGVSRLTRSGAVVGSLPYAAPEQLRNGGSDRRADVYGLGVTLYELLTLRSPFLAPDPEGTRQNILVGRCDPLTRHCRELPPDLEIVCLKAMDVDPDQRYRSAHDLATDLEHVLGGEPVTARRPGAGRRARRFVVRHPTLSAALAFVVLLALGTPLLLWVQARTYVADLERLADDLVLDELLAEDDHLWPAVPEHANAMDRWLARAGDVLARRTIHERTLASLRSGARPRTQEQIAQDRQRHAELQTRVHQHEEAVRQLRGLGLDRASSRQLARAEDELAALLPELTERSIWEMPDTAHAWQHSRLVALLGKLRALPARLERMRERAEFARDLDERTIHAQAAAWRAAAAAVAANPAYGGLELVPQRGLIPLGPDPDSGLSEFAHLATGTPAVRNPGTHRLELGTGSGIVLVLIPQGSFTMGARRPAFDGDPDGDPLALPPEAPPHEVALEAFFIAKHEMTQAQWYYVNHENPAEVTPGHSPTGEPITLRHPVENLSWLACERSLVRVGLALPTEAQWERAARAGTATAWWTGSTVESLAGAVNIRDESVKELHGNFEGCAPLRDGFVAHAPVGSFRPNAFGLHDVIGNVAEWVQDTFANYDQPGRQGDGLRFDPAQTNSVFRGGGYMDPLNLARATCRRKDERDNRWSYIGVRPARSVEG